MEHSKTVYEHMSITNLRKIVRHYNMHVKIKNYTKKTKEELIVLIMEKLHVMPDGKLMMNEEVPKKVNETVEHYLNPKKKPSPKQTKKPSPKKPSPKKSSPKETKKSSPKKKEKEYLNLIEDMEKKPKKKEKEILLLEHDKEAVAEAKKKLEMYKNKNNWEKEKNKQVAIKRMVNAGLTNELKKVSHLNYYYHRIERLEKKSSKKPSPKKSSPKKETKLEQKLEETISILQKSIPSDKQDKKIIKEIILQIEDLKKRECEKENFKVEECSGTDAERKKQFMKQALKLHPDKAPAECKEIAEEAFKKLNALVSCKPKDIRDAMEAENPSAKKRHKDATVEEKLDIVEQIYGNTKTQAEKIKIAKESNIHYLVSLYQMKEAEKNKVVGKRRKRSADI
jgi:hypothetical protein